MACSPDRFCRIGMGQCTQKGGIVMTEEQIKDIIPEAYEQIEKQYKSGHFVLTGFEDLDDMMYEFRGGVVTIAGRPAMGKTSFMYSIIQNLIEKKKKILLFSLESAKTQAVQRMLCINAGIDSQRIRSGNMQASDWEKLADSMSKMAEWELYINDSKVIQPEEIDSAVKKHKPDFVCIDYLQLLDTKSKKDRNFQIEDIMKSLSKIAKDNGVIIFLLSQLTRAPEMRADNRPLLSDLRGSSSIEALSDVVMFIYRSDYYASRSDDYGNSEDSVSEKGETEIIVAKNMFGVVGTVRLIFNSACSKFSPKVRTPYVF